MNEDLYDPDPEVSWEEMGFGPYPVTEIQHYLYKLSDGTELAIKLWLPIRVDSDTNNEEESLVRSLVNDQSRQWTRLVYPGSTSTADKTEQRMHDDNKFPAIMEYLPYCKDNATSQRDRSRHTWFASYGYVCVRPDIRGSGSSKGLYFDEYTVQEQMDGIELIEWLSSQPWSNGRVGMYGKSWGGFNGLQIAFRQPPALKAIVSLYSTDDRYTDDVHYMGGCVVGSSMCSWSSQMFLWDNRPPHPQYYPTLDDWKAHWKHRLENSSESCLKTWLTHQRRSDEYWVPGSVNEDIGRIRCPVLVVGGMVDGYTNPALRMAVTLNKESRVLIGPWPHDWPDTAVPGPRIDYLNECLTWWEAHLRDDNPEAKKLAENLPRVRLFVTDGHLPKESRDVLPGKWISVPDYPKSFTKFQEIVNDQNKAGENDGISVLNLTSKGALIGAEELKTATPERMELIPHPLQGTNCGEWCCWGRGDDLPGDQQVADANSLCFDSPLLTDDLSLGGFVTAKITFWAKTAGRYTVAARLCHVHASDGSRNRISYGLMNLAQWKGNRQAERDFPGDAEITVPIELNVSSYCVPAGDRLSLVLSPTYFPLMYPAKDIHGLFVVPEKSTLIMQTLTDVDLAQEIEFSPPKPLLQLPVKYDRSDARFEYKQNRAEADQMNEFIFIEDRPMIEYLQNGLRMQEKCEEVNRINDTCDSNQIINRRSFRMIFPGFDDLTALVETYSSMTYENDVFSLLQTVKTSVDGVPFFERTWKDEIPREWV